jgi:hypothetical protein
VRWPEVDDRELDARLAQGRGGRGRFGRVAVVPHLAGQQDLRRVAADVGAVPVQHLARPAELFGRPVVEVPVLGEAGRGAQCALLARAAHTDRRVRSLYGLGVAPRLGQFVVRALERGGLLR